MHELSFADAARPTPVVCLRLRLHPYTLGHEILLLKERNAVFLCPQEQFAALPLEQQIFAIKRFTLICSQSWEENAGRQKWLNLWGWLTRKADYSIELVEIRNYLAAAHAVLPPPTAEADEIENGKPEKGRALGSPYLAQLINFATDRLAIFGVKSVFNVPFALCGSLYFSKLESDGVFRVENSKEAETREKLDKIRADYEAEQAAAKENPAAPGNITPINEGLATTPPDLS